MVKRRPDLFWAYVGTDHTTGSDTDELSYQLTLDLLRAAGNTIGMRFEVPFFIFQGETDVITPITSARAYFDELEAPHKEFVLITQAGHLAAFAQPEEFLNELLQRVRPLAVGQMQER